MSDFSTTEDELEPEEQGNKRLHQPEKADIITALHNIRDKVGGMTTRGQNIAAQAEILKELDGVIGAMTVENWPTVKGQAHSAQNDGILNDRIATIENDLQEIKATLKDALGMTNNGKTWAQVTAQTGASSQEKASESMRREHLERHRMEMAKKEVVITLRNASEKTQTMLAGLNEEGIANGLREGAQKVGVKPRLIQSVKKMPSHGLRICCPSEKEAEELRKLDWAQAFEGAALVEPQYGIVIHGVSKEDIDFERDKPEQTKAKIENSNHGAIKVTRVTPLRKFTRNPNAQTQSVIVFTANPGAADECILYGIYIGHRRHSAERYTPQCQIKQCFNCQGYGHKADSCTRTVKCGKCGQNHETKKCSSDSLQCIQCKGLHAAWHHECPARLREFQRLEKLREAIPPLFIPPHLDP
jgi:hypothetical protein